MQNWIVETLTLVKRHAAESGFEHLTEEMDIALLVAAQEVARREEAARGGADGIEVAGNRGEIVVYPRPLGTGGHH